MTHTALSASPPQLSEAAHRIRPFWMRVLIVVAVLVTFASICRHQFIAWDDDYTIEHNARIQQPSIQNLLYYWRHPYMDLYVPVTYTVWTALAYVSRAISTGQLSPQVFHTASVLIHATNALLVYGLLRRLVRQPWPAAAGALLFALHPLQVETVAWASGMKDLLCATFSLLALNQYLRAVAPADAEQAPPAATSRGLHYALGIAAMLAGMLCKPTAMVTPLIAAILDLMVLRRPLRQVMMSVGPWFCLAVPCIVWTRHFQPAGFLRSSPIWQRPLIAADALAFYLFKLVFPARLTFDYGRTPWYAIDSHWAWFSWQVPAALGVCLFAYRRKVAPLIAAAFVFVAGVAPVLGFTVFDFEMISTVADHYVYLAMLGPALALAWALTRVPAQVRWPRLVTPIVLGLLAARAADQGRFWRDSTSLFFHALDLNADSWSSYYELGFLCHREGKELALRAAGEAKQGLKQHADDDQAGADELLARAMEFYRRTVAINPNSVAGHHGYAGMLMHFHRYPQAAREFAQVVRRRDMMPPYARRQFYEDSDLLGVCLYFSGKREAAVEALKGALQLNPPPPGAAAHLKDLQAELAAVKTKPPPPALADTHEDVTH